MNRQQALKCLVYNFASWPHDELPSKISGLWSWGGLIGSIKLYSLCDEVSITKQDWLDAKAEKEKDMIDWDNAPEGTTHYFKGGTCHHSHWCNSKGELFVEKYPEDGWQKDTGFKYPLKDLEYVERPTNKHHMPQVGEVCEYKHNNLPNWGVCKLKYLGVNLTVICGVDEFEFELAFDNILSNLEFRQIKTERDKFIEMATVDYLEMVGSDAVNSKWFARIFGAMFDAGYSKND